jgi:hypothetical protein
MHCVRGGALVRGRRAGDSSPLLETFTRLAIARGLGLVVGLQRQQRTDARLAGFRTSPRHFAPMPISDDEKTTGAERLVAPMVG